MSQAVVNYIQRQIGQGERIMLNKTRDPKGNELPTRTIFIKVEQYVRQFLKKETGHKRWMVIPGLRGVGKTTVLAQTYLRLHKSRDKINLLYVSLDEVVSKVGSNLGELLDEYEQLLGESFESIDRPTFLLIDEVQADPNWSTVLKALFERTSRVFIMCSGSSAVHLQLDPDITGRRAALEKLYPLSFNEYQTLANDLYPDRGLKNSISNAFYQSREASDSYQKLKGLERRVNTHWTKIDRASVNPFLEQRTLPFALIEPDRQQVYASISAMVDNIITKDIQSLGRFDPETVSVISRLVFILADSDGITLTKLKELLGVSHVLIASILDVLVKAELLIKVPAHGNNLVATNLPPKYLFMSPAIRAAFWDVAGLSATTETRRGKLLEDIAALHYYREFITRGSGTLTYPYRKDGKDCDYILQAYDRRQIALEFGMGDKKTAQVARTMSHIKCDYGIVVSRHSLELDADNNIVSVPLDYFLLM